MKLADALSLRKELNQNVRISETMQFNGKAVNQFNFQVPLGGDIKARVNTIPLVTSLSLIQKCMHFQSCLRALDSIITNTNQTLTAVVPNFVMKNDKTEGLNASSYNMVSLLLRRKELKVYVDILKDYHSVMREPVFQRRQESQGRNSTPATSLEDSWEVTANTFNHKELSQQLAFYSECLRLVDSAVQGLNWATEVEVPEWVNAVFIPEPPVLYVPPQVPVIPA
jgi:hypothetical protein